MRERAALDLSGILNQYVLFRAPEPEQPVLPLDNPQDPLCFAVPTRLGQGPLAWSTSTTLVHVGRICHDVNGYYRDLGVEWTASRKELAQAYMAKHGMGSVRLTYVFKQLLNSKIREAYDRMPRGETFPDEYTDEQLRLERKARKVAARRRIQGEAVSVEEVLDGWGYALLTEDEVDSVSPIRKDLIYGNDDPWEYSYYAWKTSSYLPDVHRLRRWQELLSTAASQRGISPEVVIGATAVSDRPFMLEDVNGSSVVFFSESASLTLSVAHEAIENYLRFSLHLTHLQHLSAEGEIT